MAVKLKKSYGQHFLVNKNILSKIIETAALNFQDTVLEIGAGSGILTKHLSKKAKTVVAVEIDERWVKKLRQEFTSKSMEIIFGDILKVFPNLKLPRNYKIVANIPYQITAPILSLILKSKKRPSLMVLMLQKEVAEKICSSPPNMNRLGILVQFFARPKIVSLVSKNSFSPRPAVDSAILLFDEISNKNFNEDFFRLVKIGFAAKRKKLLNNLSCGFQLEKRDLIDIMKKTGLKLDIRAQELKIKDWQKLFNEIESFHAKPKS